MMAMVQHFRNNLLEIMWSMEHIGWSCTFKVSSLRYIRCNLVRLSTSLS